MSEPSEMLARVASAMADAASQPATDDSEWGWLKAARTAIKAMREPTGAMIYAGAWYDENFTPESAKTVWQDMIDAALATPSPAIPADTPEQSQ
jgi:hypothetical protein